MPPLRPLRQGTEEQRLASAHIGARHKSLLLQFRSHAAPGRNFSESRLVPRATTTKTGKAGFSGSTQGTCSP